MKFAIGFFLLGLVFSIGACNSPRNEYQSTWRMGDSLQELEKMQAESETALWDQGDDVRFSDFSIQHRTQIVGGLEAQGSYSKKVKTSSGQITKSFMLRMGPSHFLKNYLGLSLTRRKIDQKIAQAKYLLEGGKTKLVWEVIETDMKGVKASLYDSEDRLVKTIKLSSDFETQATVYPRGPKRSALSQVVLKDLSDFHKLSSERVMVMSEAPEATLNPMQALNFNPQDLKFDLVQSFFSLDSSLKWFEEKFGYRPARKIETVLHLGFPEKTNAAFYYGGKIRIGIGDGVSYSHLAQDPSIVIHESAHSVIEAVSRLPFEGEGGSLNEGFADFFSAAQLKNPLMGEVAFLKGPYKRNLSLKVDLREKNGGLYHDSLILSGLLWNVYETLGETISLKVASRLLVEMHPGSDFQDLKILLPKVLDDVLEPSDRRKAEKILEQRGF